LRHETQRLEINLAINLAIKLANVVIHVFATVIGQITQRPKPQGHKLVVKGVEFAQRRGVEEVAKQGEFVLKGAGAGNQAADQMGETRIANINAIDPAANRV
jgi:hypothetical protein